MRGIVLIDDRSVVHVIPRAEIRYVAVTRQNTLPRIDWELTYQLAGSSLVRSIEWKGESRPDSLKDKIDMGGYNQIAADGLRTILTRGQRDIHLERRTDNVFLVRSGLVEDDARVVMCRQFIVEMVLRMGADRRYQVICDAARDLILPDWYPIKAEEPQ